MHLTVVLVKVAQDNKIVEENSLLGNKNHRIHRKIMFNQIIIIINNMFTPKNNLNSILFIQLFEYKYEDFHNFVLSFFNY